MALAVAQSTSGNGSSTGLTTSKSLSSAPTAGNLLIAFIGTGSGITPTTLTWNTASWTPFERAINPQDTDQVITALYRYVQGGDTAAMPAFTTAGSAFFSYTVQEISGVNGTWANDYQSSRYVQDSNKTSLTVPKDTTRSANCLALLAFNKYNASANSTLDVAWTSDVNANNAANYGSYGCAHQAVASSGTDITATNTFQSGANPMGMLQVIIQTAVPTVPYLVRYRYKVGAGTTTPGTVKFGGAPLSGHSLVTFLSWSDGHVADPTIGGSWTQFDSVAQGSFHQMFGLYRDVSGDTDVLAAIATAGTASWALYVCEVGGMTGVFTTDKVHDVTGAESTGATVTTTSDSTTHINQMVLTAFSEFNGAAALTESGNQYLETSVFDATNYGGWALSFDFHASSGGTVQSTWTKNSSTNKSAYMQLLMGASSATETGTAVMAFGGIAMNDAGSVSHGGTVGMAFSGIAMNVSALRSAKAGNVQIVVVG